METATVISKGRSNKVLGQHCKYLKKFGFLSFLFAMRTFPQGDNGESKF